MSSSRCCNSGVLLLTTLTITALALLRACLYPSVFLCLRGTSRACVVTGADWCRSHESCGAAGRDSLFSAHWLEATGKGFLISCGLVSSWTFCR